MNNREMNLVKEARKELKKILEDLPDEGKSIRVFFPFGGEEGPRWTMSQFLHFELLDDLLKRLEEGRLRKGPKPPGEREDVDATR
jgi:hypothetical protein